MKAQFLLETKRSPSGSYDLVGVVFAIEDPDVLAILDSIE